MTHSMGGVTLWCLIWDMTHGTCLIQWEASHCDVSYETWLSIYSPHSINSRRHDSLLCAVTHSKECHDSFIAAFTRRTQSSFSLPVFCSVSHCVALQQHLLPALHSLPVRMCEITDFHVWHDSLARRQGPALPSYLHVCVFVCSSVDLCVCAKEACPMSHVSYETSQCDASHMRHVPWVMSHMNGRCHTDESC